MDRWCR